jgi:hypothetical protein
MQRMIAATKGTMRQLGAVVAWVAGATPIRLLGRGMEPGSYLITDESSLRDFQGVEEQATTEEFKDHHEYHVS